MGSPCTRSSSNSWRLVTWPGSRWSNPFTHTLASIVYMDSPAHGQHGVGQRLALRGVRSGKLLPQLEERRPGIGRFGATGRRWPGRDHLGKPTCQIGQELQLIVRGQLIHQALRLGKCTLKHRALLSAMMTTRCAASGSLVFQPIVMMEATKNQPRRHTERRRETMTIRLPWNREGRQRLGNPRA